MKKNYLANEITRLIDSLSKLPGIGSVTASRLALHLMKQPAQLSVEIAKSMVEARRNVKTCETCNDFVFDNDNVTNSIQMSEEGATAFAGERIDLAGASTVNSLSIYNFKQTITLNITKKFIYIFLSDK